MARGRNPKYKFTVYGFLQMSNLFSIFDPCGVFTIRLRWLVIFGGLILIPARFWTTSGEVTSLFSIVTLGVNSEFRRIFSNSIRPGTTPILVNLFLFIGVCNLLRLVPYVFTPSSHMSFTLTLALPVWLGYMIFWGAKNLEDLLAHLVPQGTPVFLISFMVLIEIISSFIRPLTLSVRLAANMIAGHLLLCLLGRLGIYSLRSPLVLLIILGILLLVALEFGVALIQSYVFRLLRALYVNERTPNNL